jgi:DNA repair photolyase
LSSSNIHSIVFDMRWDNLRLDLPLGTGDGGDLFTAGRDRALPLIERGAVARTFDTPGFRGMTFFEVQAKSVVNRVPEASRMPFRWTINPYRGCQHACVYCAVGETPVLMADGRTKPLAEVRAGDAIYGTARRGNGRAYVRTTVLAHWSTVKPAYRVVLADGTQLVCSGDHRFLTERGWRYVAGTGLAGLRRRPYLAPGQGLMGTSGFAEPPKQTAAYRRGYLCGLMRGGGSDGHYSWPQLDRPADRTYLFRLPLAGPESQEGLARAADYLGRVGIGCVGFSFSEDMATPEPAARRELTAVRTGSAEQVRTLDWLLDWPDRPAADWHKGFLAGIFDAHGSYADGILRLAPADPAINGWLVFSLESLGFGLAVERPAGQACVRVRGDLGEALRFFHTVDPAITSRRSIEARPVGTGEGLQVAEVERLGLQLPMYDITTGTGDFIANGVVSHNCFARNSHTYLDLDAGADFNTRVVVKVNAPELVRKKMASPSWAGEHIAIGMNVDCYQRAEGKYQLMPGIIAALRDAANPFSILTKGTLILRDIELLAEAAEVTDVGLNVSAGFVDKDLWRSIEPGTPAPGRRLEACAALNERGLRCGVLMGPVVPFLSDSPAQLDATVRQIAETGAGHVTPIVLHLRPGTREWFFAWLRARHPGLVGPYLELYGRGAYAPKAYQNRIAGQVRELADKYAIGRSRPGSGRGTLPCQPARPESPASPVSPESTKSHDRPASAGGTGRTAAMPSSSAHNGSPARDGSPAPNGPPAPNGRSVLSGSLALNGSPFLRAPRPPESQRSPWSAQTLSAPEEPKQPQAQESRQARKVGPPRRSSAPPEQLTLL